jgi:hypothetical protein
MDRNTSTERTPFTSLPESFERYLQDKREGRQGLRWSRVDLETGTMRILGKDQSWETAPIPSPALRPLRVLKERCSERCSSAV